MLWLSDARPLSLGDAASVPEAPGFCYRRGEGGSVMAKNGFRLIDAEMHVMEPVDLWQRYIDPEFAARAPRRLDERRWDIRTLVEGEVMAQIPGGDWPALSDAEEKSLGDR